MEWEPKSFRESLISLPTPTRWNSQFDSSHVPCRSSPIAPVKPHHDYFVPTHGLTDQLEPTARTQQDCTALHVFLVCVKHPVCLSCGRRAPVIIFP
jgi:hypothetical protein